MSETLFRLPEPDATRRPQHRSAQKRAELEVLIKRHGILIRYSSEVQCPWLALLPLPKDVGRDIFDIMADSCRIYDECGSLATGNTKREAVKALCDQLGLK